MTMQRFLFYGLIAAWFLACVKAEGDDDHGTLMMRSSYCACRCCEGNKDICFRHKSIPATFKCSESNCNKKFCDAWDHAKCAKNCFCKKCKGKLNKDDYRCISEVAVAKECDCEKHKDLDCSHVQPAAKELNEGAKMMASLTENLHCVLPCFCQNCKDSLPPEMYGDCMMSSSPGEECQCEGIGCPSQEVLDKLKLVKEMRARNPSKNSSAFKFSEEIDNMMSPEKAKDVKCKMQCYCDVCGQSSEKIYDNCEKMLPKPRVKGCDCKKEEINCPSNDIDQQCRLYCFCRGCKNDPRMNSAIAASCKDMAKKDDIGCMCADEEDCSILDAIPKPKDAVVKEKPKKGKLKKKTKKDEL